MVDLSSIVIENYPLNDEIKLIISIVNELLISKKYGEALDILAENQNPYLKSLLVKVYYENNNYDMAIKTIDECIRTYPDISYFIEQKYWLLINCGKDDAAKKFAKKNLDNPNLDFDTMLCFSRITNAPIRITKIDENLKMLMPNTSLSETYSINITRIKKIMSKAKYRQALHEINRDLKQFKDHPSLLRAKLECLYEIGEKEEANKLALRHLDKRLVLKIFVLKNARQYPEILEDFLIEYNRAHPSHFGKVLLKEFYIKSRQFDKVNNFEKTINQELEKDLYKGEKTHV